MIRLRLGQGLNINSVGYVVTGCISYRNGSDTWDEYTLKDAKGGVFWLSVDNNDDEYVLSTVAYSRHQPADYRLVDQGTAVVTSRFGNTDVDVGETVRFSEYEDAQRSCTFSVEEWCDETEYSQGHYVNECDIQILDKPPFKYYAFLDGSSSNNSVLKTILYVVVGAICLIFAPLKSCLGSSDYCKSCSPSDPNYAQCQAEYNNCVRDRSIRQASRRTRSSSGGGTSHGK